MQGSRDRGYTSQLDADTHHLGKVPGRHMEVFHTKKRKNCLKTGVTTYVKWNIFFRSMRILGPDQLYNEMHNVIKSVQPYADIWHGGKYAYTLDVTPSSRWSSSQITGRVRVEYHQNPVIACKVYETYRHNLTRCALTWQGNRIKDYRTASVK